MTDRELIRGLEERLVNVWPSVETLMMDGWVVRLANGYTSRANSASAIVSGADMSPDLLDTVERIYAGAGLPSAVRVTPVCDPAVEKLLLSRGYRVKDRSRIMLLALAACRGSMPDSRVHIERHPSRRWIEGVCAHQAPEKRNAGYLEQIVNRIRVPAGFATLSVDGAEVGFAMCAVDRGYAEIGSVIVAASQRGRGLGRATTGALLAFGVSEGAHHAFLQVDAANTVAIGLYSGQGFVDVGGYLNMVKS
jgi:ribosomal protein S18 acetylase RimI-like enzyme